MIKVPMGMILKQIIDEKKLKAQDVADKLGMSRQSVYQSYAKLSMSDGEIVRWAGALGVTKDELIERWKAVISGEGSPTPPTDSEYLREYMQRLEEQFNELKQVFAEELSAKNRQIEKLMDLLGKHDLSESTTCQVVELRNLDSAA